VAFFSNAPRDGQPGLLVLFSYTVSCRLDRMLLSAGTRQGNANDPDNNIYSAAPMPYMQRITWSGSNLSERAKQNQQLRSPEASKCFPEKSSWEAVGKQQLPPALPVRWPGWSPRWHGEDGERCGDPPRCC